MSSSQTYTVGQMPQAISIGDIYTGNKPFPNKKFSISVHQAHGGYIVEVHRGSGYEGDLYIIADDKDLGQEIGKIITHSTLAK
jgi:hypothetical protein